METQYIYKHNFGDVIRKTFSGKISHLNPEKELLIFIGDLSAKGIIDMKKFSEEFIKTGIRIKEKEK